jgi:hypothetical protein
MGKGRSKVTNQYIDDAKLRKVCYKKRRIGLVKKAMQLSLLTDCEIELRIHFKEDNSLVRYVSGDGQDLENKTDVSKFDQYIKF